MQKHPNILNVEEAHPNEFGKGRFGAKARRLAASTGGKNIGCNWYEIAPGKTAFPRHYHTGIEEALFILNGSGVLQIGDDEVMVKAGDYVTLPPGPQSAHSLENQSEEPLRYLAISNQNTVDIIGYPDSKKFSFTATPTPEKGPWVSPWVNAIVKESPSVDYYEDENT
jgi:uncharacterized cupin superfamily protein